MMCRFEFVMDLSDEDAQTVRAHVTDSCFWQRTLLAFFLRVFNVRPRGLHQFRWTVARDLEADR